MKETVTLDSDVCYRAVAGRDRRFEGRFVVAVKTTGIYCRPGCPAPIPKRVNVRFYAHAAAAEAEGFRPCRRCRPDASPDTPAWNGTAATVTRAMKLISAGALDDEGDLEALAARLGIGARHLRRLFAAHVGASPVVVAQTRRVHFARRLVDETDLPMAQVALSAGFSSTRRFNDSFRRTFRRSPSEVRGHRGGAPAVALRLRLPYKPPFDWDSAIRFLRPRAIPGVETVGPDAWRRNVRIEGLPATLEVRPGGDRALELEVRAPGSVDLLPVVEKVRRVFDLGADPLRISESLARDRRLASRVRTRPGLRVPGAWCGFELAVRAVLGQQVSVAAATTLAGRIAERWGDPVPGGGLLFPLPATLADARVERAGVTGARAATIRAIGCAVADGTLAFDDLPGLEASVERLTGLPGVGPWTAHYIAMRAFGEPDAFPASDLGLRKALGGISAGALEAMSERWRPWRSYAAMHLWTGETR
jgi:AraC family transcriptional regulator of adaptative response / DNA-3-methyladenine glycosylase II